MSTESAVVGIPEEVSGSHKGTSDHYDIFVLDASIKQGLASVRSLARVGLRVAAGESIAQFQPRVPLPAFKSRYCSRSVVLPDLVGDAQAFVAEIMEFVRQHSVRVVLPCGDATIGVLRPHRQHLAELGCVLALAPESALEIANDKGRTLLVAERLDIPRPRTIRISSTDDLDAAIAEFGFPFVLKPTISWTGRTMERLVPVDVVDKDEAAEVTRRILDAGVRVLAQEWVPGRREGATLFIMGNEILAACGHIAHRTTPPMGGVSVVRESIDVPADTLDAAVRLVKEIGIQGVCEVEFRRDANDRPLLMEINARLAGTIENAVQARVDFPLMIWQWAMGLGVAPVTTFRSGIRTRWLHGDLRWLWQNWTRTGRPDGVSRGRSIYIFIAEFAKSFHYDSFDARDIRPFLAEIRYTIGVLWKSSRSGPR
jgi:predicted ATP-grasp superfamily ATP-dependent carboligase